MGTDAVKKVSANEMELAYEQFGDPGATPLLLVMGLGGQMIAWDERFCERLVEAGFFVTRYDNRDVGLSTHLHAAGAPDIGAGLRREAAAAAYVVDDMAEDAAALLHALDLAPAHVVGVSLGGMIAQALTIAHPECVRSLTSIMSTPSSTVGPPKMEAVGALLAPPPTTKEEAVEAAVRAHEVIGSPGFAADEARIRAVAAASWERDPDKVGTARQLMAVLCAPDRTEGLGTVRVPTLVIHGAADPLVQPEGGEATAAAVPGAELLVIDGMGHDLPEGVWDTVVDRVRALATRADGG